MQIRLMQQTDITSLFNLWEKAKLPFNEIKREQYECEMMLNKNPTSCFVAIDNHKIIGSIFGTFNGRRAWIYHLAVDPVFQRKGIGKALYAKTEEALKTNGATKIIVGVATNNLSTSSYYKDLGFNLMDDAVLFSKDLY